MTNKHEYHEPVLFDACLEYLSIVPGGVFVDVTFGGGGHSAGILEHLTTGRLIAFDRDADAHQNRIADDRLELVRADFEFIEKELTERGVTQVNGILADLGISSHQVDTPERGFSFRFDAELDMRMDQSAEVSAKEIVNSWSHGELARIFKVYGELPGAGRAASAILRARERNLIQTTRDLENAVAELLPRRKPKQYLSQLFQALRIEVNGELDSLRALLEAGTRLLAPGGRFVIMSYHSLEDRMVKNFFRTGNLEFEDRRDFFGNPLSPLKVITRKAIQPTPEEIERNPRARSARLRVAEKLQTEQANTGKNAGQP